MFSSCSQRIQRANSALLGITITTTKVGVKGVRVDMAANDEMTTRATMNDAREAAKAVRENTTAENDVRKMDTAGLGVKNTTSARAQVLTILMVGVAATGVSDYYILTADRPLLYPVDEDHAVRTADEHAGGTGSSDLFSQGLKFFKQHSVRYKAFCPSFPPTYIVASTNLVENREPTQSTSPMFKMLIVKLMRAAMLADSMLLLSEAPLLSRPSSSSPKVVRVAARRAVEAACRAS